MDRCTALEQAEAAAGRAAALAGEAERHAYTPGSDRAPLLATAGSAWADTSRAYTALADALTTTSTEQTEV
jgi:hypothetical protein